MWITRPLRTFIGARNPWDCQSYRATSHATYAAYTTTGTGSSYWPIGSTNANAAAHCATNSYTPDTMTSAVVHDTESNASAVAVERPRWR